MEIDLTAPISLIKVQRLKLHPGVAGTERSAPRVMRLFVGALHRLTAGRTSHHATFDLTEEAKVQIGMV